MKTRLIKKVLVTGAQGVLGSHVAKRFLRANCEVTGTYFGAFNQQASLEKEGAVHWVKVDVSDSSSVKEVLKDQIFDALIHCAGGFRFSESAKTSDEDLDFLMNVNLRSAFYLVRELLPGMKSQNFGRIVFISSRSTLNPTSGMAGYSASKAGLNMLTASLAEETKSNDITVNAVLPSIIDTPVNRKDMPNAQFSDWVSPEQLAEIIFFLTSPQGAPIHGALLPVSGRV